MNDTSEARAEARKAPESIVRLTGKPPQRTEEQVRYVDHVRAVLSRYPAVKPQSVANLQIAAYCDLPSTTRDQQVSQMIRLDKEIERTISDCLAEAEPEEGKPLPYGWVYGEGNQRCLAILSSRMRAQDYRDQILRVLPMTVAWVVEVRGCEVWARHQSITMEDYQ